MDFNISGNYSTKRKNMVNEQIKKRGISNKKLISALLKVPRHEFVPDEYRHYSYYDGPLPIGEDQTISQPYIVALMTELLNLKQGEKVLEIGTGCGYQTAVLSELDCEVYTIEIVESLGVRAKELLDKLGYKNIYFKIGDGYKGWEEKSPFDAIIVTASPPVLPQPLLDQLKTGGRMVIPIEEEHQELKLIIKKKSGLKTKRITPVRFVPMTGEAEKAVYN
jgi:protein-L-isoaspartate(D-aspartate) O-methyltransferase